jgi:uncharacterized protein YdaU (DUF1376 family)
MKPPAFQFYPDDFLGGVADMTQAEVGAYILLLCSQWGRGEIPSDPERAALIAKGSVSAHVLAKFPNGKNPRLESVRIDQDNYRQQQREKGFASAEARRNKSATTVQPQFNHGSTTVQPDRQPNANPPSPSPSPILLNLRSKESAADATPVFPQGLQTPEFADAWKDWVAYRKERGQTLKPTTIKAQLGKMQDWGATDAVAAIRQSIMNGWQGIFEPRSNVQPKKPGGTSTYELEARAHGYTL